MSTELILLPFDCQAIDWSGASVDGEEKIATRYGDSAVGQLAAGEYRLEPMKYLLKVQNSQIAHNAIAGQSTPGHPAWTEQEKAEMYSYMESLNNDLVESGQLVDANGLVDPNQAKAVTSKDGVPTVIDNPYGDTQVVVVGYWVVECDSIGDAVQIAARAYECPTPDGTNSLPIIVHPILEAADS